jgi:hypothetical protein
MKLKSNVTIILKRRGVHNYNNFIHRIKYRACILALGLTWNMALSHMTGTATVDLYFSIAEHQDQ